MTVLVLKLLLLYLMLTHTFGYKYNIIATHPFTQIQNTIETVVLDTETVVLVNQ